jgi:hypothetical protein
VENAMKSKLLITAALGALVLSAPVAFGQTESSSTSTTTADNPRAVAVSPHAVTNNTVATHSGVGFNQPSQWGRANSVYVQHEIEKAKADGKDVSAAQTQYNMAMNALNNGLNKEAAQHFDNALRAVGVQPNTQGQNPGEPMGSHAPMPGQTKP